MNCGLVFPYHYESMQGDGVMQGDGLMELLCRE